MQKPSFWRVLVAYIIDSIILLCLSLMWWMLGAMGIDAVLKPSPFSLVVLLCVWGAITVVYFALLERKGRGSVGKQICKLKIQPSNVSFRRLFASYAVDYCLLVLIGMCVYAYFIYFFFINENIGFPTVKDIGFLTAIVMAFCGFKIGMGALLVLLFYFSISESCFGKTLGKKLMGLQVVQDTPENKKKN